MGIPPSNIQSRKLNEAGDLAREAVHRIDTHEQVCAEIKNQMREAIKEVKESQEKTNIDIVSIKDGQIKHASNLENMQLKFDLSLKKIEVEVLKIVGRIGWGILGMFVLWLVNIVLTMRGLGKLG